MKNAEELFKPLWDSLNDRQKEVIAGRFGLAKFKKPQTLAALGKKYGITRERVRQIEASALKLMREKLANHPEFADLFERNKKFLRAMGGIATKDSLITHQASFAKDMSENHLAAVLAASDAFHYHSGDEEFHPFYYVDQAAFKTAAGFVSQWADYLEKNKEAVLAGGYDEALKKFIKSKGVTPAVAANYLAISKRIHSNPYGDKGLMDWPEIKPATIRDRIYLILKKSGEPLHFQTIAENINKAGIGTRQALAPTVHNELIKDERFVLVGRGMYGLSEHGYAPGTAREVIHRILKDNGPLKPKDVILAVQKERFLKPNTVLVNLQNKNYFQRRADGAYQVKES